VKIDLIRSRDSY